MATLTFSTATASRRRDDSMHRVRLGLTIAAVSAFILCLAFAGFSYYRAPLEARPFLPEHAMLRSSGTVGLKLGMLGVAMFGVLFLYPLRKRSKWLSRIGSTRHWLDFHAVMGITAPIVITFHSAFKLQGLAGLAYWIMIAVALSGFVGRYVYAQIPRSMNSTRLSAEEVEAQTSALAALLEHQDLFRQEDLAPLLRVPKAEEIRSIGLLRMLCMMLYSDLARPFLLSRLRRRAVDGPRRIFTLGGLLSSHDATIESILSNAARQSRLRTKLVFLQRTERIFHLWHVIHRPFSLSFVALVVVHITVVLLLGYY